MFNLIGSTPVAATPVRRGNTVNKKPISNDEDWTVLKLEHCLGDIYPFLVLKELTLEQVSQRGLVLEMAGYPSDRWSGHLTVDSRCKVHRQTLLQRGGWRHDCATRPGNSGSPIYTRTPTGELVVVAMAATERGGFSEVIKSYNVFLSNGAVPIKPVIEALKELFEEKSFEAASEEKTSEIGFIGESI